MTSGTQYQKEYERASSAYMQGDYQQAEKLTKELVNGCPNEPMYRLLHAHTNLALERYQDSINEYENVLRLTDESSIVEYAHSGIAAAKERLDLSDDMGSGDNFNNSSTSSYTQDQGDWASGSSTRQNSGQVSTVGEEFDFEDFSSGASMNGTSEYNYSAEMQSPPPSYNSNYPSSDSSSNSDVVFMDEFDDFDDMNDSSFSTSLRDPDTTQMVAEQSLSDFGGQDFSTSLRPNNTTSIAKENPTTRFSQADFSQTGNEAELFGLGAIGSTTGGNREGVEMVAEASEQGGLFSPFDNMPLKTKTLITAIAAGVLAIVAAGVVTNMATGAITNKDQRENLRNTGWMMAGLRLWRVARSLGD